MQTKEDQDRPADPADPVAVLLQHTGEKRSWQSKEHDKDQRKAGDKKECVAKYLPPLERAAAGEMKGILGVSHEPYVSSDLKGDTRSSIVDAPTMAMLGGTLVKVLSWYDNEWGYANRLADLCYMLAYGELAEL